jgi:tetratricopeptide (TPR) repeat protein/DNA-binding XRE family transcriptional regulator
MVKNNSKSPRSPLRMAREELGWSQQEVAEKLGTTKVVISRWERGEHLPSPYSRQQLAKLYGKTPAELGLLSAAPSPPEHRTWNIPIAHTPYFTGRDDLLNKLHERLSKAKTAALTQPQALFGLGGIGKTRTAGEYAYRHGDDYSHVFWIRAATRDSLLADFIALAQRLELPEQDEPDQMRILAAVQRWLAEHEGWLLIMDNADDLPLAREFLPRQHKGHVLFTTRAHPASDIAASVEVEKLSQHEGTLLLLRWSNLLNDDSQLPSVPAAERAAAERLVREMDGLPLAIVQAGAFVQETGCSLSDYLNLYTMHRQQLLKRKSRRHADHPETVATTWSLSFQQIEEQSPAAADLLRLLAFLSPDAIPEELLTRGSSEAGTTLAPVLADSLQFNETLGVLFRYSLIQRNANTISMHRLVQTVLKESMDPQTQHTWAERTVRTVNAAFPDTKDGGTDIHFQPYLPHIQECATLIKHYNLYSPESARLLFQAGYFLFFHGFHPQSQLLHQQALTIREQIFGSDDPSVADSLNALAILARNRSDYEQAEKLYQQALAIREKRLGPHDLATAESLNNLGVLYRNQGKYEMAEPLLRQALNIREQLLGSEHLDTLYCFLNLAKLYLEQHKYEHAQSLLSQALETGEALGIAHPLIAHNLNLLARLFCEQEDYEEAETLWKRSLAIMEQTLGLEHPATAGVLNDLAELYAIQGLYTEAQTLCERAISISEKRQGTDHPETIAYREHLTRILSKKANEGT